MNEFIKRLFLPTPSFFKKVRTFGGALSGIGFALMALEVDGSKILDFIKPIAPDIIAIGAVIVIVSQLTVKPEVPNKEL